MKDMPDEWFVMPERKDMEQDVFCSAIGLLSFNRAMDCKDLEKAREIGHELCKLEDKLLFVHRCCLFLEMAYLELIHENREENEEERKQALSYIHSDDYKKFESAMKQHPSVIRLQYTYALLEENDEQTAPKYLSQFYYIAKNYPNECEIQEEKELIEIAENVYKRRN